MGWIPRNKASVTGTGTLALAVTAGDLIVVFTTATVSYTLSDNVNGTYTLADSVTSNRPSVQSVRYKIATTTATVTITNGTGDSQNAMSFGHDGGAIPGTVNATNKAAATQTVNLTTTVANTLVVGCGDASTSNAAGSGFTLIFNTVSGNNFSSEYQTALANSAGTITVALVQTTQRSILGVAFDPPAVSGVFIPIIGRGPGMALAGRGGLVGRSRYQANDAGLLVPAHLLAARERSIHVSR